MNPGDAGPRRLHGASRWRRPASTPHTAPSTRHGPDGVTPTLNELVSLRMLVAAAGRRRGQAGMTGPAASSLRGRGMEYAESRDYVAGDDARHIDWRVTARTGRAHTKVFQVERERTTWLLCDTAPALYVGTRVRFKSVQAARAGAVAAWAAVREGDRIAALRGTTREPPVPPGGGPRAALRVLDALTRWYAAAPADDEGFALGFDHARRLVRPGARVVALCDVRSTQAVADAAWAGLAARHEVVVVLLVDPLELEPPRATLPLRSDGVRSDIDLASPSVRARWQARFGAPVEAARVRLAARGVRVHVLSTDAPSDAWRAVLDAPRPGRVR